MCTGCRARRDRSSPFLTLGVLEARSTYRIIQSVYMVGKVSYVSFQEMLLARFTLEWF